MYKRAMNLLALVAMLYATTADAYFLNRDPLVGNDAANGKTPATAWLTVDKANGSLPSDSTIYVSSSDYLYDVPINPANPRTKWVGDSTNCRNVKIPGASLETQGNVFIGLSFWGGVTCLDSQFDNGRGQLFRKCGLYGFNRVLSSQQRFESCEIGSSNLPNRTQFYINADYSNGDSITINNCTMFLRNPNTVAGDFLLNLQPVRWDHTDYRTMQRWSVTANTCTLRTTIGQHLDKVAMFKQIAGSTIRGNSFLWQDSTGLTNRVTQALCVRDSFSRNMVDSNTFVFKSMIPGSGNTASQIYSSGSEVSMPDSGNVWRDNVFKSDVSPVDELGAPAASAFRFHWHLMARDSILRNVFVSNTYLPTVSFGNADSRDTSFIRNNLFANLAGGPALITEMDGACDWNSGGVVDIRGNIFYGPLTTDGVFRMQHKASVPGSIVSDYNLFWTPLDATRAEWLGPCGTSLTPTTVGTSATYDANSLHACPVFVDSTFDGFDATVACNSSAIGTGLWGRDAGPVAYDASLCAPSPITDLRGEGSTSNSVILSWTAPGAAGDVGQAQLYSLRYSTSTITSGNFASADTVAYPNIYYPRTAGAIESAVVPGLTPNTTYYFAIKALGSEGIYSGLSNVATFTTRKANVTGGHAEP